MPLDIPGSISPIPGVNTSTKYSKLYNNQFFDYLSEQLPRDHKGMLQWCEVVYANTPVVVNAVRMLINYPITELVYKSEAKEIREDTKKLLEDHLDIYSHILSLGLDFYIYGNALRNIYFPFTRFLECASCGTQTNIKQAKFEVKRFEFVKTCGNCKDKRKAKLVDKPNKSMEDLRLVSWNPKQFELLTNEITGETSYYYSLNPDTKMLLMKGEMTLLKTIPEIFIRAAKEGRSIKMGDNFYHFKTGSISGMSSGWGISPLVPTLKLYLYVAILRKAVESIGLEHITPQRILYPQGTSNDPSIMSSMGKWREHMQKALEAWRRDPNYVMMAPYPTGVVNIGSQGRSLMPTNEIKAAEEDMLRALDVPPEFVFGSSSLQNSPISLRILENRLRPYVSQVTSYINWIIDTINAQYGKQYCHVEFTPFKLSDDLMQKQLMVSLMGNGVSKTTIQETLSLDPDDERNKLKQETLDDMRVQRELQEEQAEEEASLARQVKDEQQAQGTGTIPQYNQQQMIAQAQLQAQQLLAVPYEERRSYLAQIQNQDYVMWALITKQMETLRDNLKDEEGKGGVLASGGGVGGVGGAGGTGSAGQI